MNYPDQIDAPRGATHYFIVDGLDKKGRIDYSAGEHLQPMFLQTLSSRLPSVNINTLYGGCWERAVHDIYCNVKREIPVLVLDVREHKHEFPCCSVEEAEKTLFDIEYDLNQVGETDIHMMSKIAFLHTVVGNMGRKKEENFSGDAKPQLLFEFLNHLENSEKKLIAPRKMKVNANGNMEVDECESQTSAKYTEMCAAQLADLLVKTEFRRMEAGAKWRYERWCDMEMLVNKCAEDDNGTELASLLTDISMHPMLRCWNDDFDQPSHSYKYLERKVTITTQQNIIL